MFLLHLHWPESCLDGSWCCEPDGKHPKQERETWGLVSALPLSGYVTWPPPLTSSLVLVFSLILNKMTLIHIELWRSEYFRAPWEVPVCGPWVDKEGLLWADGFFKMVRRGTSLPTQCLLLSHGHGHGSQLFCSEPTTMLTYS